MQNQRQGSRTQMVRQSASRFPGSTPIDTSFTPERAASTTHFFELGRAALRGELLDMGRAQPQPSKQFQKASRPVPTLTPSMLTPDHGEDQDALVLPEMIEDLRHRLAQQARESRDQRRADQRARLHQLLTAPTDEAAPDFVVPASLQEGRQGSGSRVQVTLARPVLAGPAWGELSADEVLNARRRTFTTDGPAHSPRLPENLPQTSLSRAGGGKERRIGNLGRVSKIRVRVNLP